MTGPSRRRVLSAAAGGTLAGLAGCLSDDDGSGNGGGEPTGDWRTMELSTVRSDEPFTVAGLAEGNVVFVETFAVWCSNCLRQQQTMVEFHGANPDVTTVAVDIDPNEDARKVRDHAEENGFGWRYAVAPEEWTASITDEFGSSMANAPSVPMLRLCGPEDATRLKDGGKSVEFLESKVEEC
jgi:thiol-disulfide isomerase/thioredoxin